MIFSYDVEDEKNELSFLASYHILILTAAATRPSRMMDCWYTDAKNTHMNKNIYQRE